MKIINVGIIGTGSISNIYCENLTNRFENTRLYACTDLNFDAAEKTAQKWNAKHIKTTEELISCPDIDIVLNLTPPQLHYTICKQALLAGKHVYTEKPLALRLSEGQELVEIANLKGLMLGCAPETNYGAGIATAKKLIADNEIGEILSADAQFHWHGDENWHPNPDFLFQDGAGPLFDRGPYFINALVELLGSADTVFSMNKIGFPERIIGSVPHKGEIIHVTTPTHIQGLMHFANNAIATLGLSFDMKSPKKSYVEICGTKGSIRLASPVFFGGPVEICHSATEQYIKVELVNSFTEDMRGYAVSRMAGCIVNNDKFTVATGLQACHILEIMENLLISGETGLPQKIKTKL